MDSPFRLSTNRALLVSLYEDLSLSISLYHIHSCQPPQLTLSSCPSLRNPWIVSHESGLWLYFSRNMRLCSKFQIYRLLGVCAWQSLRRLARKDMKNRMSYVLYESWFHTVPGLGTHCMMRSFSISYVHIPLLSPRIGPYPLVCSPANALCMRKTHRKRLHRKKCHTPVRPYTIVNLTAA